MSDRTNLIYRYDGTTDGMLTCIYEAMTARETPMMIVSDDEMQSLLFPDKRIETDHAIAARVSGAIYAKISPEALDLTTRALLTALPGRETYLLDVIRRAFKAGPGLISNYADPAVNKLRKAINQLEHEAHLYTGFVRFQENDGILSSVIEPKNQVLPLLSEHFSDRFAGEAFLIYDKTHASALIHRPETGDARGQTRIVHIELLQRAPAGPEELAMQSLWRGFCHSVAIEGRTNPTCQRGHMPLRYRNQMPETQSPAAHQPLIAPA